MLKVKTDNSSNESLSSNEKPKAIIEVIQPLTEREVTPDKAMQILDG